ncbi:TPA: N-acetyltransferase, partial [Enterococcus faecium]|nr:N-acetyltransferase [Enterococcus faecium]
MTKEVVIRKVRFLNNQYYDSVKYSILWEELAA